MRDIEFHVVSTGRQEPERLAKIVGLIHPYIDAIHIREKTKTAREIYHLVELLSENKVPLSKIIINDRLDVAYVTKVKGVQLAYHSLPTKLVKQQFSEMRVGCSIHSVEEAKIAQEQGAAYVIFGHVFPTKSKPELAAKGLDQLNIVSNSVTIPVIAIGGIHPSNCRDIIETGASGIAVMSGVLEAENPLQAVKEYQAKLLTK